jgi:hypothetical protein
MSEAQPSEHVCIGRTISYGRRGDFIVFSARGKAPDDEEWASYVAKLKTWSEQYEMMQLLVMSDDSAPTAAQRSLFNREVASQKMRVAAVLGSKRLLPIAKVFAWFVRSIEVFGPSDVDRALRYLGGPPASDVNWLFAQLGLSTGSVQGKGG